MRSTCVVVDLGFGDAGKGTIVDALARRCSSPPLVVRYNGGAQAGHNVHTSDGRHHTFSQFGAATFVPGARTLLSEHMILHPPGLMVEHEHLKSVGVTDALQRLVVDARALVITPYQQAMNRLREFARGAGRHGTCGLGVGETVGDSLELPAETIVRASDLTNTKQLRWKLSLARGWKREQLVPIMSSLAKSGVSRDLLAQGDINVIDGVNGVNSIDQIADMYVSIGSRLQIIDAAAIDAQIRESEHVIFEGAQGVLLDEWRGFHPHTTWSTTTTRNAYTMLGRAGRMDKPRVIGVVRAYATRHGQGPFPTEDAMLTQQLRETHNVDTGWQGNFRAGWFDVPLARYAKNACPYPITELAITHLDRLMTRSQWSMCVGYEVPEDAWARFVVERYAVGIRSPNERGDLAYQEQLGRDLLRCKPVMRHLSNEPMDHVRAIETGLDMPCSIMSFGPTAEDKRWR